MEITLIQLQAEGVCVDSKGDKGSCLCIVQVLLSRSRVSVVVRVQSAFVSRDVYKCP